jgi:hypothetical protein
MRERASARQEHFFMVTAPGPEAMEWAITAFLG